MLASFAKAARNNGPLGAAVVGLGLLVDHCLRGSEATADGIPRDNTPGATATDHDDGGRLAPYRGVDGAQQENLGLLLTPARDGGDSTSHLKAHGDRTADVSRSSIAQVGHSQQPKITEVPTSSGGEPETRDSAGPAVEGMDALSASEPAAVDREIYEWTAGRGQHTLRASFLGVEWQVDENGEVDEDGENGVWVVRLRREDSGAEITVPLSLLDPDSWVQAKTLHEGAIEAAEPGTAEPSTVEGPGEKAPDDDALVEQDRVVALRWEDGQSIEGHRLAEAYVEAYQTAVNLVTGANGGKVWEREISDVFVAMPRDGRLGGTEVYVVGGEKFYVVNPGRKSVSPLTHWEVLGVRMPLKGQYYRHCQRAGVGALYAGNINAIVDGNRLRTLIRGPSPHVTGAGDGSAVRSTGFFLDGTRLSGIRGVAVQDEEVLIIDSSNNRILVYSPDCNPLRYFGEEDLNDPHLLATRGGGYVAVGQDNGPILVFQDERPLVQIGLDGELVGICFLSSGELLVLAVDGEGAESARTYNVEDLNQD